MRKGKERISSSGNRRRKDLEGGPGWCMRGTDRSQSEEVKVECSLLDPIRPVATAGRLSVI